MKDTIWVKLVLALAGITGVGIGLSALFWPRAFFASSGTILGDDISLMSEVRAPAMVLVLFGGAILGAVVIPGLRKVGLWAAAMLYLSYGMGRVISVVLDGVPHVNILTALGIELVIGLFCAYILWSHRAPV